MEIFMKIIATIHNDYKEKFGIPRQSGLVAELESRIVFEPQFRRSEALRGLLGYSHLWLIWNFSRSERETWSPTVRPPRLGGNRKMGVFATRSPFRPNPIGLSAVRLIRIEEDAREGSVLIVSGADLLDGTPIFDIKPYIPFSDCIPTAKGGFADEVEGYSLPVDFPEHLLARIDEKKREALKDILASDPRPSYHDDGRIYGFRFASYEIKFKVEGETLTVTDIEYLQ